MAAFSSTSFHQHHPFLLDSVFPPNSPSTDNKNNYNNIMSISPPHLHQSPHNEIIADSNFNQQTLLHNFVDNDASLVNKNLSMDDSSSIDTSEQVIITPLKRKRKSRAASSPQSKDKGELTRKKQKKLKDDGKKKNNSKEENKAEEAGYIHVRARRGQATDSHSLAERVRRERISERMKLLQDLVPGCDKVNGKALMLDEIINYVQSLQNQVEFLSMKLASMNPMFYDFGSDLESFMVRPDQDVSELPSPMESMQECSLPTNNNYNYLEINFANSILFQQLQQQESRQSLWKMDEHRQKIINQSGFNSSLFSFH